MRERIFGKNKDRDNISQLSHRIDDLYFFLERPVYYDDPSSVEIRRRDLRSISQTDFSFLNYGTDGSLYPRPRLLVQNQVDEVWIGISSERRRIRFEAIDGAARIVYEELREGEWACLYEQLSQEWDSLERLVEIGEKLVNRPSSS